jgi:hypothetical protein
MPEVEAIATVSTGSPVFPGLSFFRRAAKASRSALTAIGSIVVLRARGRFAPNEDDADRQFKVRDRRMMDGGKAAPSN